MLIMEMFKFVSISDTRENTHSNIKGWKIKLTKGGGGIVAAIVRPGN